MTVSLGRLCSTGTSTGAAGASGTCIPLCLRPCGRMFHGNPQTYPQDARGQGRHTPLGCKVNRWQPVSFEA